MIIIIIKIRMYTYKVLVIVSYMQETDFLSLSLHSYLSLAPSHSTILVSAECVCVSAFTDTYFISKRDFSVCDLLPLPWYIYIYIYIRAQKYIDFKLATTTRYTTIHTHTLTPWVYFHMWVCVCRKKGNNC